MSGSEMWQQFLDFLHAVPPWLNALPVWLTTLLTLAVGFWIGRVVRSRSTRLQEQEAAREALQLAVEAIKIDPTFRAVPGLGHAVLDQLKRQKRLKVPPELARRLTGADADAAPTDSRAETEAATADRQTEPESGTGVETASAATAGDDAASDVAETEARSESQEDEPEQKDSGKGAFFRRTDH